MKSSGHGALSHLQVRRASVCNGREMVLVSFSLIFTCWSLLNKICTIKTS